MRGRLFVFALIALMVFTAGSAWAAASQSTHRAAVQQHMSHSAALAGVKINTDDIQVSSNGGAILASATIDGFEGVSASELPDGVDAGFIYFEAEGSEIPAGFYTLRASAQDPKIGDFAGNVDLVDADGRTVAKFPASITASSLTVPNPLPFPRTTITQDLLSSTESSSVINNVDKRLGITIRITIRCPNGMTIRITIRL